MKNKGVVITLRLEGKVYRFPMLKPDTLYGVSTTRAGNPTIVELVEVARWAKEKGRGK